MPEDFLLELPKFKLPYKVTAAEEIRCVCVLTVAGLIESESWPRLSMTARFQPVRFAWVERITPDGFAEIARIQLQAVQIAEDAPTSLREARQETERVPRTSWIEGAPAAGRRAHEVVHA